MRRLWNVRFFANSAAEAFDHLDAPVQRVTGADIPMPYAQNMENASLPTIDAIVNVSKKVCYRK